MSDNSGMHNEDAAHPNTTRSLTLVNVLDELDLLLTGRTVLTPQALYVLNTVLEAYVLTDELFLTFTDAMHLNLAAPAFSGKRPLLQMLISDHNLRVIGEGKEHLAGDTGVVIHVDSLEGEPDDAWLRRYREAVCDSLPEQLVVRAEEDLPSTTPLLVLGKGGVVARFDRSVTGFAKSILSLASADRFHPALPPYAAQAETLFFEYKPPAIELYRRLAGIHRVKVEDLLRHRGVREISLPPLLAILLGRAKSREEIPTEMKRLRAEFEPLRLAARDHERRLAAAVTLGEQIDAIDDFNSFWDTYAAQLSRRSTRLLYRVWNVVKSANPLQWFTDTIDHLATVDQDRVILSRYAALTNLWAMTRDAPAVHDQRKAAERVFRETLSPDRWSEYGQMIRGNLSARESGAF